MPRSALAALLLAAAAVVPSAPAAAQSLTPGAAPAAGVLRLPAGVPSASLAVPLRSGPESGIDGCAGFVGAPAPDAVVEWGGGDLSLTVQAEFDPTLVVHRPDGTWACNDDMDGLFPVVTLMAAPRGRYAVWVGSFMDAADASGVSATLIARLPIRLGADAVPLANPIRLEAGFEAASGPRSVDVQGGGPDGAGAMTIETADGVFCSGYIQAARPSAVLTWGGGDLALIARADADLTLVVQQPSGEVACNDDAEGMNPGLVFGAAAPGRYVIWVGTFEASAPASTSATLSVSEVPTFDPDDGGMDPDIMEERVPFSPAVYVELGLDAAPRARLVLGTDAAAEILTSTTPDVQNPLVGAACIGFIERRPTVGITLGGDGPVALTASASEADLVLAVRTPAGAWFCSDDADGLNPGVQIDEVERGTYLVWVGGFSEGGESVEVTVSATRGELVVSGFDEEWEGEEGLSFVEGTYDGSDLQVSGAEHAVDLTGTPSSESAVQAGGALLNPVLGSECQGFVERRPTASVRHRAGGVSFWATGDADLTLVVRTPDGRWFCSDDADGSDPMVSVDGLSDGTSSVWVGTFSRPLLRPAATLYTEAEGGM